MTDFLEAGGHRLEYAWHGARGGPTLVFLHEGLGCVQLWRDFPQRLSEASGLPAFVYSRAGYGKSSPPALPRPVRYMHDEALLLPQVLAAAGIDDAILYGHSDGASIAILYAGGGARVRGLILEAPHVFTEALGLASIARTREAYLHGDLRTRLARYHENVDAAFWGWNDVWLHPDFRAWNIEGSLPAITAPSLLLQGADDEYGTPAQLDAIARGSGGQTELLLFDHAGHAPHRYKSDTVLSAASGVLERWC